MKIIHTADWHLGKQLHKYSLEEDHRLFLDWLAETIIDRKTDLLLVSGDIFDTAFPSNSALNQYYLFLQKLIGTSCKVVITGGNHDSPGVLNAPREILDFLHIKIAGCIPEDPAKALFPFEDLGIAVAAVPFLRETDLRRSVSGQHYDSRQEAIRAGIKGHYENYVRLHKEKYPHLSLIGMGHLYVNGATTTPAISESEREIHTVGGLPVFGTADFPEGYEYIALGHIHRPQSLAPHIRYSGSPVPLSFSEKDNPNFIIELTFDNGKLQTTEDIPIPAYRELKSFSGTLADVREKLKSYDYNHPLESLIELNVQEPDFDPAVSYEFEQMLRESEQSSFRIIKPRLTFLNRRLEADELFEQGTEIADLTEKQVFARRLESENLPDEEKQLLNDAFDELLAEIQQ